MTRIIARLILAMLLLPATGAVFLLMMFVVFRGSGPPPVLGLLGAWAAIYAFIAIYWVLLWRSLIRWTFRRVLWTIASAAAAIGSGVGFALLCLALNFRIPPQPIVLAGGGLVPIVWVLLTVLIWQETPAERIQRLAALGHSIACPICGYSMAGLREARCPECGSTFTLDQLISSELDSGRA